MQLDNLDDFHGPSTKNPYSKLAFRLFEPCLQLEMFLPL